MRFAPLFFCLLFLWASCNSSKTLTGEVTYLGSSEPGTLLVSAAGYGESKAAAIGNAEVNAFQNLIFRGIPGSQYRLPMIKDEARARHEHAAYFTALFEQAGYRKFVMKSDPQKAYSPKGKNQQNISLTLQIHVDALRRDMEQHQVIRKFGL